MGSNLGTKQTFAPYANVLAFMGSWRSTGILALLQIEIFHDKVFQKGKGKALFNTRLHWENPKPIVNKQCKNASLITHVVSLISACETLVEVHYKFLFKVLLQTLQVYRI